VTAAATALHLAFAAAYAAIFLGALLLARSKPPYAAALLTGVIPFALYTHIGHTDLTLAKFALVGALLGVLTARRPGLGAALRALTEGTGRTMLYALIAMAAVAALSIAVADFKGDALRQTLKALQYLALFAVTAILAKDDATPAVAAAALATLAASIAAIAQLWTGTPSAVMIHGVVFPRIAGPLEGPNQLAAYLDLSLPLLLAFAIGSARASRAHGSRRAFALVVRAALIAGSVAMLLTLSRAGIAAALIGLAAVALWMRPARARAPQAHASEPRPTPPHDNRERTRRAEGIAAAVGLTLGPAIVFLVVLIAAILVEAVIALHRQLSGLVRLVIAIFGRADTESVGSVGTRGELWRAAIALWWRHPWLGVGAGNYELELDRVGLHGIRTQANSAYLQALAETGVIGLAAQLALTLASIVPYARRARANALFAGVAAGSLALALHGIVDTLTFYEKVGQFWICVCALPAALPAAPSAALPDASSPSAAAAAASAPLHE